MSSSVSPSASDPSKLDLRLTMLLDVALRTPETHEDMVVAVALAEGDGSEEVDERLRLVQSR